MAEASSNGAAWYAVYPAAKSVPSAINCSDLLAMMDNGKVPGRDFVLVDLRRSDHEGGTIFGSINLPAQSLYTSIPTLYNLLKAARISRIVWYCGSSRGRGNRAAAWFADYLLDHSDDEQSIQSLVLVGGIKSWAGAGEKFTRRMHEYDSEIWKKG